jgi:hypothetical protein
MWYCFEKYVYDIIIHLVAPLIVTVAGPLIIEWIKKHLLKKTILI